MKKNKKLLLDSVFQKTTIAISVIALTFALSTQLTKKFEPEKDLIYMLKERSEFANRINDSLMLQIQKEQNSLKTLMEGISTDSILNDYVLNQRLNEIDKRLNIIQEQNTALRQAINPLNPEEVLTIARLNDGIKLLSENHLNTSKNIDEKFTNFKTSVFRELDASSKSINWLFVVIIPIVMNLLYTIWKDSRKSKSEKIKDS
ncbi:hypothetical protein HBA12_14240 [Tenacibaculum mesophilum]|uniref:hypothetical protein n=1 Tax=Tenacibaculum mesophilum TaxID=104268 RepID=UPI0014307A64|nr:hypothetical protein [Tenacibaculum mesophilum]KAF9658344.1 hypothetical protein HBA12_14240 [Tenacibaculum mesophilum]